MIDNQLRSVLFQIPTSGNPDCLDGPTMPTCFNGVVDLGAIDLQRGRDHGMGTYNQVRNAYGLSSKTTFTSITGESTDTFPAGLGIDSPSCLDIIAAFDINGNPTTVDADNATRVVRRCTLAAKLKAIYGSVSNVDAFVGMMSEKHVSGSDLGPLQLAIWQDQFGAARDGDRFFYQNDPLQSYIRNNFGIDSRKTLAQVISLNTDVPASSLPANVFRLPGSPNVGAGAIALDAVEQTAAATGAFFAAADTPSVSSLTRHDGSKQKPSGTGSVAQPATTNQYPGTRHLGRRKRRRSTTG
jgi:hypothetical protein